MQRSKVALQQRSKDASDHLDVDATVVLERNKTDLENLQRSWSHLQSLQEQLMLLRGMLEDASVVDSSSESRSQSRMEESRQGNSSDRKATKPRAKDEYRQDLNVSVSSVSDVPSALFFSEDDEDTKRILRHYYQSRRARSEADSSVDSVSEKSSVSSMQKTLKTNRLPPRPQSRIGKRPPSRKNQYATSLDGDSSTSVSNLSDEIKSGLTRAELHMQPHQDYSPTRRGTTQKSSSAPLKQQGQAKRPNMASAPSASPKAPSRDTFDYEVASLSDTSIDPSFASTTSSYYGGPTPQFTQDAVLDLDDVRLALRYTKTVPSNARQRSYEEFTYRLDESSEEDNSSQSTTQLSSQEGRKIQATDRTARYLQAIGSIGARQHHVEQIPSPEVVKEMIEDAANNEAELHRIISILVRLENGHLRSTAERLLLQCRSPNKRPTSLTIESPARISTAQPLSLRSTPSQKSLPQNYFVRNLELGSPNKMPDLSSEESGFSHIQKASSENSGDWDDGSMDDQIKDDESYNADLVDHGVIAPQKPYDYSETADTLSTISTVFTDLSSPEEYDDDDQLKSVMKIPVTFPSEVSTQEESESQVSSSSTARLDREYTAEIEENEAIIASLKDLIDSLSPQESKCMTRHTLYQLSEFMINALSEKTIGRSIPDSNLVTCLRKIFFQYCSCDASLVLPEIIQKVSDLLYDEMIFSKVAQQVDHSYEKEIDDMKMAQIELHQNIRVLDQQRCQDMSKLEAERRKRLAVYEESGAITKPSIPVQSKDSDAESYVSVHEQTSQNSEDDYEVVDASETDEQDRQSVENLPTRPLSARGNPVESELESRILEAHRQLMPNLSAVGKKDADQAKRYRSSDDTDRKLLLALLEQYESGKTKRDHFESLSSSNSSAASDAS
eukprot:TRINITY_DN4471_c0_g1_i4.p1 TRINITY_DN4471_c0_g1~~TRINITY_DN4471_c0_g1_i4.p1  ORF type:complete len:899 (+),score=188.48 TRINITY_DN4471_c0_g1_i4:133-2829(+)